MERLDLFPQTARVEGDGHLWAGGCDTVSLAGQFGTPLYLFDEATLRANCRTYIAALAEAYPAAGEVAYAGKAWLSLAWLDILAEEGLGLDVVSGGELYLAQQAGFPPDRVHFHGNNKSAEELTLALDWGMGRIVVDNHHELELLDALAARRGVQANVWLRLSPGIDIHTHVYRKTGLLDSKFGFPLATGDAESALRHALASSHLIPLGLHTHLGSLVYEVEPFVQAVHAILGFVATMADQHGFVLRELSPGGGWGVPYSEDDPAAPIERYVRAVSLAVTEGCAQRGLPLPKLILEPGRSIVAPAGLALYTVGSHKDIPGVRIYVSVNGGMADNIRPALYGSRYTALVANKADAELAEAVTVAGKYCESGDVLIKDIFLPHTTPGDILAIPMAGAYNLPLASNYNLATRPAVVLVREGNAHLIQRRETFADLMQREMRPIADHPAEPDFTEATCAL
jgi:diaminopimelate decarboxylase